MATVIDPQNRPRLVRYETTIERDDGVVIYQNGYLAIAETPKYYFVVREEVHRVSLDMDLRRIKETGKVPKSIFGYKVRKVAKEARVSHCYVDEVVAWNSFRIRQQHRMFHIQKQMDQATKALEYLATNPHNPPTRWPLGHTPFTEDMNWNEY